MTAYNRGQVLYRVAEMLEARAGELAELCGGREEVERAVDRSSGTRAGPTSSRQVLGGANPVAGPYFNFTVPEPTGVVGIVAPGEPALLGLVSRLAPVLAGGNAAVVVASEAHPRAAIELGEVLATSDVPGGVVNILTGRRDELAPHLAAHLDVDALDLDRGRRRARARRRRQRQARRVRPRGRAEPVRDLELPRAQDGLAPDGAVALHRRPAVRRAVLAARRAAGPEPAHGGGQPAAAAGHGPGGPRAVRHGRRRADRAARAVLRRARARSCRGCCGASRSSGC